MVNLVGDAINNYSEEEIIEYLYSVITGVVKNYKLAVEKGDSAILYGNLGDIVLVSSILRGLKKRNDERLASRSE